MQKSVRCMHLYIHKWTDCFRTSTSSSDPKRTTLPMHVFLLVQPVLFSTTLAKHLYQDSYSYEMMRPYQGKILIFCNSKI